MEPLGQSGQEFVRRRLLHETNQRLERAEVQGIRRVDGKGGSQAEFGGHAVADGGNEHPAADIGEEFTASIWSL